MTDSISPWTIPHNSISCFIGRICSLDKNFEKNGIMWVDLYDLDGKKNGVEHDEDGTTQRKAIASWTIRSAYAAWKNPPIIKLKGKLVLKGKIKTQGNGKVTLDSATLSQVNISGGAPLQGTTACAVGSGTATIPVNISSASGTCKIETSLGQMEFSQDDVEFELHTGDDPDGKKDYNIQLKQAPNSLLPWCTDVTSASIDPEDDDQRFVRDRKNFIEVGEHGDMALCMALGNSLSTLYCVDILI